MRKILIIVDPQNDFIDGTLAVPGALKAMYNFYEYAKKNGLDQFDEILVTIDNHPINHCSFIVEGGIFPIHCVAHTVGAAIHPLMEKTLFEFGKNVSFFTKGEVADKEEFSIFRSELNGDKLLAKAGLDHDQDSTEIYVMGIAGDYCVHDTILDLLMKGYGQINVLTDFIASLDEGVKLKQLITDNAPALSTLD